MPSYRSCAHLTTTTILAAIAVHATSVNRGWADVIDVRECPVHTITFIDPWAGGEFRVERAGTAYSYLCGPEWRAEPAADEQCRRYGDLILEGTLVREAGAQARKLFAIWSVIPAVPCCGWSVYEGDEGRLFSEYKNFRWLDDEEIPKLGEFGFASIDWSDSDDSVTTANYRISFGNPKYAMKCEIN